MVESEHRWSRSRYPLHGVLKEPAHLDGIGRDQEHSNETTTASAQDERRNLRRTPRLAELPKVVDAVGPREHVGNAIIPPPLAGVDLGLATEYSLGQHRSIEKALEESVTLDAVQQRLQTSTSKLRTPADSRQSVAGEYAFGKEPSTASSIPGPTPSHKEDGGGEQRRQDGSTAVKGASRRRKGYPLQSPASTKDLRLPPSPPSSSSEIESQPTHAAAAGRASRGAETSKAQRVSRRKGYPLQSPASINDLQRPISLPSSPERSTKQTGKTAADQKDEPAWQRRTYPLQPPDNEAAIHSANSLGVQEDITKGEVHSEPIHLPKHIRAATDSKKAVNAGRTIVVMLDGTGDKFDDDNSNIVHIVSALKKDDPNQVTYYQAGIGTYGDGGLSGGFAAAADMAVGSSLGLHVRDAYHFLMHSYKEGDKICIFGFSRGAYTARCLAGMIHKVGLLPPRNIQQIPFAYDFYKDGSQEGWEQSEAFKATFSIHVCVYFLGCFDSVASVGFIPRQLPLSSTPTSKSQFFRHAMSLDERRAKFKISRYRAGTSQDIDKAHEVQSATQQTSWMDLLRAMLLGLLRMLFLRQKAQDDHPPDDAAHPEHSHPGVTNEEYGALKNTAPADTDVLEVWFAGDHADVGGGAVANSVRHKAAQIPLRWMIRQAFECDTGIIFNTIVLAELGLDVHTLWPTYRPLTIPKKSPPTSYLDKYSEGLPPRHVRRSKLVPIDRHESGEPLYHLQHPTDEDWTPEQMEDFFDSMAPLHDQLELAPNWWILEYIPVEYVVPIAPGNHVHKVGMNLGRFRGVIDKEPIMHWTVKHRMQHMGYKIKARTAPHTIWRTTV